MTKIWINGITGRMGQTLKSIINDSKNFELLGGSALNHFEIGHSKKEKPYPEMLKSADLVIDFSSTDGNLAFFEIFEKTHEPPQSILIATTGMTGEQIKQWSKLVKSRGLRCLIAPNTSLGVLIQMQVSKQVAKIMQQHDFDIEILESHHRYKKDSPSGTAKFLAENIASQQNLEISTHRTGQRKRNELGLVALRGGNVFGEHTIKFLGLNEELEIKHTALSRDLFAKGALVLGDWLKKQDPGLYQLEDVDYKDLSY